LAALQICVFGFADEYVTDPDMAGLRQ
jgi:hypothetical protein